MAVEIQHGRFYCTTSETEFGPQCDGSAEAEALQFHIYRTRGLDIRELDMPAREKALAELRDGTAGAIESHSSVVCFCGSGKLFRTKQTRLNQPSRTWCGDCNGTEQKIAGLAVADPSAPPSSQIIDLFGALKNALGKGQASSL